MLTLRQIPGFADVADSNFAAEQYALGLNVSRVMENAKFGVVRPEVFVGTYVNGDTVPLPVSTVDGYTYTREELTYSFHFTLTGGFSPGSSGVPSQPGAIRFMAALVDQTTGKVYTNVEYLVANGSAPAVTTDGTLVVFTIGIRRRVSMVVLSNDQLAAVNDSEMVQDAPVTDSLMQRLNRNAKFAALRSEVIYMGEFVNGDNAGLPVSPVDGYQYSAAEVIFFPSWRWTTQGSSLQDPVETNYHQINNLIFSVSSTGTVTTDVEYYNSGVYPSTHGRVVLVAFCQRTINGLGVGSIDFTDIDSSFLSTNHAVRADVLQHVARSIRFSALRCEFFDGSYSHGQTVALPVSPVDGYQYSRDELTYVFNYSTTKPATDIRIYQWQCMVDQAAGLVTSNLVRCQDGGGSKPTNDGTVRVITVARRGHEAEDSDQFTMALGSSNATDNADLVNGGFDNWNHPTDTAAVGWSVNQQSGAGYAGQAPGVVAGLSQRLGATGGAGTASVLSSSVRVVPGDLRFFSFVTRPSAALPGALGVIFHLYDAIGDTCSFAVASGTAIPSGSNETDMWVQIPQKGDTQVLSNTPASVNGAVPIVGTLDFTPSTLRIEFVYTGSSSYFDLDQATFISQADPSIGQIASRGSTSLAFFPAINWQVTDTTFQPTLNFNIQRVDGTITPVSDGAPTVTGLTQSTDYKWYPYLNERTGHTEHVSDGGVGNPPWLQTTATRTLYVEWYEVSHLPYAASPIDVVTLASGSGTGGGGSTPPPPAGGHGGGDDGCLEASMLVRERTRGTVAVSTLKVGDELASLKGTWLPVLEVKAAPHRDWCELEFSHGGSLLVTAGHPFETEQGIVRAHDLTLQHLITWDCGVCAPVCIRYVQRDATKVKVTLSAPHVFFAGRDWRMTLTHNFQMANNSTL